MHSVAYYPGLSLSDRLGYLTNAIAHARSSSGANTQEILNRIQDEVDLYNERFGNWEKVKRFELTSDIWSIDAGHLTPTMKLKRKVIKEKYNDLYLKIYGE